MEDKIILKIAKEFSNVLLSDIAIEEQELIKNLENVIKKSVSDNFKLPIQQVINDVEEALKMYKV